MNGIVDTSGRKERKGFLDRYGPESRQLLEELLEKYADHGTAPFVIPDILEVPPISAHGTVVEIAARFGGAEQLREAVELLHRLLYLALSHTC